MIPIRSILIVHACAWYCGSIKVQLSPPSTLHCRQFPRLPPILILITEHQSLVYGASINVPPIDNRFYSYFSSLKPIIVSQPLPRRFFAANSMVLDYPYGHLADVGNLLTDREALFVMYYAPWCAKSRWVRSEFEQAADYMRTDVSSKSHDLILNETNFLLEGFKYIYTSKKIKFEVNCSKDKIKVKYNFWIRKHLFEKCNYFILWPLCGFSCSLWELMPGTQMEHVVSRITLPVTLSCSSTTSTGMAIDTKVRPSVHHHVNNR